LKVTWKKLEKKDFDKLVDFFSILGKETLSMWKHYGPCSPQYKAVKVYDEKSYKITGWIEGEIVAYGYLVDDINYPGVPAMGLVVRDDYQNAGIGKDLVKQLIKAGQEIKATAIYCTAFDENKRAQAIIEELGWKRVGITYVWKKKSLQYKLWLNGVGDNGN